MKNTQDPKYGIANNRLFNVKSHKPIPEDEPIFILRGQDVLAVDALFSYRDEILFEDPHRAVVHERVDDFLVFARDHSDRMKQPDS